MDFINNMSVFNQSTENLITEIPFQVQTIEPFSTLDFEYNIQQIYGPKRDSLYIVLPITIIYMIIFITGVIGNISTCIVISKNRSMHTATNYYLFSLAISDFLLLVSGLPQEMYSIWSKYPYVFGEIFCVLRGLAAETSANATVLTITSFTVERYVAICHPFLSHTMSTLNRAVRLILLIWLISIALAIPQALQFGVMNIGFIDQCVFKRIIIEHSFEISTFVFFFTPMTLITVLYVLIGLKLRSSNFIKRDSGGTLQSRTNVGACRQQTNLATRRVLKMLVAVVVAFFICWAPFHSQRLVAIYGKGTEHREIYNIMTYISGVLYYLSTCINPLLYNIMSNKFRVAFKETLGKCCQLSKRRYDKKRTYRVLSRDQRRRYGHQESTEYSGSSFRDESMHSTSTQKQSFDSMTLSRAQSVKKGSTRKPHNYNNQFDDIYNSTEMESTSNNAILNASNNKLHMSALPLQPINEQYHSFHCLHNNNNNNNNNNKNNNNNNNKIDNIDGNANDNNNNPNDGDDDKDNNAMNAPNQKLGNIQIIVRNKNLRLLNDRQQHQSRITKLFNNIFQRNNSRNISCYSPPLEKSKVYYNTDGTAAIINLQLDDVNLFEASQTGGGDPTSTTSIADGVITNSSSKDVHTDALQDELSSYMEEIQKRQ